MDIENGDLIKSKSPFYAGIVIGEGKHALGDVWFVVNSMEGKPQKPSMIFKDDAELWVKGYHS